MGAGPSDEENALRARLALTEARLRSHEEVLHEIGSTVGGVHAAARVLLQHGTRISEDKANSLQQMLSSELGRLDRLLAGHSEGLPEVIELDALLAPLVQSHRLVGHQVLWVRTGLSVVAVADDLSEAVNVLLTNAAKHGKGATVRLSSAVQADGSVEIVVSDDGPGVPEELREVLFERGVRHDNSTGEGLGLYIAQRRMQEQSAQLDFRESDVGACFVITLPHTVPPTTHSQPQQP